MKSPIDRRGIVILCLLLVPVLLSAQLVESNPGEYAVLTAGYANRSSVRSSQTAKKSIISAEQAGMALLYEKMAQWEKDYSRYLQGADGYVETLKATTSIYVEAVSLFYSFKAVKGAMSDSNAWFAEGRHGGGAVATFITTDLYLRVGQELVSIYQTLEETFKGGLHDMLDAEARCKNLWMLQDAMHNLNKDLRNIAYLTFSMDFTDAFNKIAAGRIGYSRRRIALQCHDRWRTGSESLAKMEKYETKVWMPDIVKDLYKE